MCRAERVGTVVDLPSLGYQEYAVIFLLLLLLGLLRGWRMADLPRAERIKSHMRVSKGLAVIAIAVLGYFLIVSISEGLEFRKSLQWVFVGLMVVVYFSLLFGLPFMIGLLLWPHRRNPGAPG